MNKDKKLDIGKMMQEIRGKLNETSLSAEEQKLFSDLIESRIKKTEPVGSSPQLSSLGDIYRKQFFAPMPHFLKIIIFLFGALVLV